MDSDAPTDITPAPKITDRVGFKAPEAGSDSGPGPWFWTQAGGKVPFEAVKVPSEAVKVPSEAVKVLSEAVKVPSEAGSVDFSETGGEVERDWTAGKPSGLLSKATWTRGLSSSLSKTSSSSSSSSSTTKAPTLTTSSSSSSSSSSPPPPSTASVDRTAGPTEPSLVPTNTSVDDSVSSLPAWDLPTVPESLLSTVGDHDFTLPANITSPFSTHQWNTTMPARPRSPTRRTTTPAVAVETSPSDLRISSTPPPPPLESSPGSPNATRDSVTHPGLQTTTDDRTTASTAGVAVTTAEGAAEAPPTGRQDTPPPETTAAPTTRQSTSPKVTATSPKTTTMTTTQPITMDAATTVPVLVHTTLPPSTTAAEEAPLPCNVTEKYWVRTVLSIELRRNRLDLILKHNLSKGLSHALQRALNDSNAYAQVEREDCGLQNVTLGFYVTSGKSVFVSSMVVESLTLYGFDKLLADVRQHAPPVRALLLPVATWTPAPSIHLQLRTVLRFVGPTDNIYSCSFVQMLEQRLENAYDEAQDKVLETYNMLSVEIQSVSQEPGSPSVSLVYVVKNQGAVLNGTISSGLLNQLTAELVGYFLFYPPLVIAEPLEYHNLNTSAATKSFWVITVIQDVDSSSLEANYQSFASLMEQRLAELFLVAGRQGPRAARARRATTVGGYTVQMVSMRRLPGPKNPAEMTYYAQLNGAPISGTTAAKTLSSLDSQTMALTLGYFVQVQAEPVVKTPPGNLWIMAVLTPLCLLMVVIGMVAFILCKRNRVLFKTGAFRTFKSRSKKSGLNVCLCAAVVKTPPGNLWIMAVLTPLCLLMVVIGMVAFILCKRNRVLFKTGAFRTFKSRSKTSYRREGSYHHQVLLDKWENEWVHGLHVGCLLLAVLCVDLHALIRDSPGDG
ncbi:unnamed protein product [Menidia menidia]|uniref:(Atlantic silverside) hypothetical protein n=1 Tax=Menidia menidia TaxID=238744 RepID=A0A8S4BK08_9TELE|nr:unnamed protein product [Menidia menidia]